MRRRRPITQSSPLPLDTANLDRCNQCGMCLPVCPTYRDTGVETQSPRGRIALIRAAATGSLAWGEGLAEHMRHCLYCMACESACPSGVQIAHRIAEARAIVASQRRPPLMKRIVLRYVLTQPRLLEASVWPMRLYQRLGIQWLVHRAGLVRLLPRRLRKLESYLPLLPWRPLLRRLPEVSPAEGVRQRRVGFFLGCVMSLVFAEASKATVEVLQSNGCEVVTPKAQKCCGAPHESEGDVATLKALARHNIDVFEAVGVEVVVADCAACSATLKSYGRLLRDEPAYRERAAAFSARAKDITELLTAIPLREPLAEVGKRITYHEACHLCHAQGISAQPRALLQRVPGARFTELPEATWCCGSAGSYVLTHHERSETVLAHKMEKVAASGAETVVTTNPGCLLQLCYGARKHKVPVEVAHLSEVLRDSYTLPPQR
ncbi:MAG: (Fe-S)-binding protein [Chloroflexi bacterium]|nr:(Fe-S)-binding protein [Chloroflexota bacterium]